MALNEPIEWTEEEQRIIRHEAFIAETNRIRNPGGASSPKPSWQRFLESTGGTALITVFIGGIFGAIISACIQSSAKEREFQQTWLQARGEQAMVGYKDFLDKQQETVKKVFERVGATVSASEDLISLTKPELTRSSGLSTEEDKGIAEQIKSITDGYNVADRLWNNERDILGISISYYFPNRPDLQTQSPPVEANVMAAWDKVKESVNNYKKCAVIWISDKFPRPTDNACLKEKGGISISLIMLNKSLEANRRYSWEGWENPDRLREILSSTAKK